MAYEELLVDDFSPYPTLDEEALYAPMLGSNVRFENLNPADREMLTNLLGMGQRAGQPQMGLEQALANRQAQGEAQGWSGPNIYPTVMPDAASYAQAQQVGGYAGPLRESDRPFQYPIKATRESVDVEEMNRLLTSKIPGARPESGVQTIGDLQGALRGFQGAPKEVVEGLVSALTGIDKDKSLAEFTGKTAANVSRELAIREREAAAMAGLKEAQVASNKYQLIDKLSGSLKELGTLMSNPLFNQNPDMQMQAKQTFGIIAQMLMGLGGTPGGQPGAATPPPQSALPPGVRVRPKAGPTAGAFETSPQGEQFRAKAESRRGEAAGEARVIARARELARAEGMNPNAPPMFLRRYIDQARRELVSEP